MKRTHAEEVERIKALLAKVRAGHQSAARIAERQLIEARNKQLRAEIRMKRRNAA